MPKLVTSKISVAEARMMPATITAGRAFDLLGMEHRRGYEAIHTGEFPVKPIRIGGRYYIPTAPLLKLLGIEV
jgi:hypothetical protein